MPHVEEPVNEKMADKSLVKKSVAATSVGM
jgi:hypothetical protein